MEEGQFVAHALELDLVAYGETEKEAMKELHDSMMSQLSFAAQMEKPEMINHPAPKGYFKRWDDANRLALSGLVSRDRAVAIETKAVCCRITPEEMKEIRSRKGNGFERIPESALASA